MQGIIINIIIITLRDGNSSQERCDDKAFSEEEDNTVTKEPILMCRLSVRLPKKERSTFLSRDNTAGL